MMTANSAPPALLLSEQTMRSVDSSQAIPLRMPRWQQWRVVAALYSRYLGAAVSTRARGGIRDQALVRCLEENRQRGGEQPFGRETSAGGDCNTGGFLMRFFWEKNTPQHNLVSENCISVKTCD